MFADLCRQSCGCGSPRVVTAQVRGGVLARVSTWENPSGRWPLGSCVLSGLWVDFQFLALAIAFPDLVLTPGEGVGPSLAGVCESRVDYVHVLGAVAGGCGIHFPVPLCSYTISIAGEFGSVNTLFQDSILK